MNVEHTHVWLEKLFPADVYVAAHLNLIRLGREICFARRPDCPACPLQALCVYYAATYLADHQSSEVRN